MLNENVLLQVLKDNFEKVNKTKLSDFENDLFYVKKRTFLKITKKNLEIFTTESGDNFFGYKGTPQLKWIKDITKEEIGFKLKVQFKTGEKIDLTERNTSILIRNESVKETTNESQEKENIVTVVGFVGDTPSKTLSLINGQNCINCDTLFEPDEYKYEDAFYIVWDLPANLIPYIEEFDLELYKYEYEKIPLSCLGIDSRNKLPVEFIDTNPLDEKFAPIVNPVFNNSIILGPQRESDKGKQGQDSFSSGEYAAALGFASFAQGIGSVAEYDNQFVIGTNNKLGDGNLVFIIGNGPTDLQRLNMHTVDRLGNAWYAGDVHIGGEDFSSGQKLATEQYANQCVKDAQTSICLTDTNTGLNHIVQITNGVLNSFIKARGIQIKQNPVKLEYSDNNYEFDSTGMKVVAICEDGSERDITEYVTYNKYVSVEGAAHIITYKEHNVEYIATLPITTKPLESLDELLVDFDYTVNEDGAYELTNWKKTLNGVSNDNKILIPNSNKILL